MYPSNRNEKNDSITSQGGGDGIPKSASKKKTSAPSSRKLNTITPKNESLKLKLDTSLQNETEKHKEVAKGCIRSASMAEITPTKSAAKKKMKHSTMIGAGDTVTSASSTATLYTPRPFEGGDPILKKCTKERYSCDIYRRLMLLAWRQTKKSLKEVSQVSAQQSEQVTQLERQNVVLNDLRKSEEQKRTESLVENQKMRKILEALDFANDNLTKENQKLNKDIENYEGYLATTTENFAILNEKTKKLQEQLKKKLEEKRTLEDKLTIQEKELYSQKVIISHMQDLIKGSERNCKNTESNLQFKTKKYALLKEEHKGQLEENIFVTKSLKNVKEELTKIKTEYDDLQSKLQESENCCASLTQENELLKYDVKETTLELEEEKTKTWMKNTKDLVVLTIEAMHKVALIMLPAYREF